MRTFGLRVEAYSECEQGTIMQVAVLPVPAETEEGARRALLEHLWAQGCWVSRIDLVGEEKEETK